MKSIEEQIGGKCIHFNGLFRNECCKAGVNYKQAFGDKPVMHMPCIKDRMSHIAGEEIYPCDKLQFPTPEEVKKQVDEGNKSILTTLKMLSVVEAHIKKTGEKKGKIKCPNGDHDLVYVKADYNGHIHMSCTECKISMMQ